MISPTQTVPRLLALLDSLACAACGSGGDPNPSSVGGAAATITITSSGLSPKTVQVSPGVG